MAASTSARHHGARAPPSHGNARTPRAPGGLERAAAASAAGSEPTSEASHSRADPAAESPPSSSHPPLAPRVTVSARGGGSGRSLTGTDTFAVVPHDTIGRVRA